MNILITGVSGFLGWHAAAVLALRYRVWGISRRPSSGIEGIRWLRHDLAEREGLDRIFEEVRPDVVIHTAAMTRVSECDVHRDAAMKINIKAVERIAALCARGGVYLVHASTDLVFDGERTGYTENDRPNPVSYYARTKRVAEEVVSSFAPPHTIVRFALLYGPPSPHGRSFLGWMGDGFRNNSPVTLFSDQYRTPLYVNDAVALMDKLIETKDRPPRIELLHAGGPERLSRADIGRIYCDVFGYDSGLIRDITMAEKYETTNDAADVSLSIDKARTFLGFDPVNVRSGFEDMAQRASGR
jgi:dTDP-4-dehydrorhamnose reductase